jgi:septal ring factor EnvC (AmiA/AmiB activator)
LTESNNDNFYKLDSYSKKLAAEFDSLKFKYDETIKDLFDATIKLQLTVKVRQESEHYTKLLQVNYGECKNDMLIFEDERKKQVHEISRLQKVNQEFQKEIFLINEQKSTQEKMMNNAFESFNQAQAKNSDMILREKQNTGRINRMMDEEKDKINKLNAEIMKLERSNREAENKLSRMTIERNVFETKLD